MTYVRRERNEKCVVASSFINLLIVVQRKSRQNSVFFSVEGREELNRVCFFRMLYKESTSSKFRSFLTSINQQ